MKYIKMLLIILYTMQLYGVTNVYLINRTPFKVTLSTDTIFPKDTSEKPQWSIGSKSINPGQKEKILTFARDEGVKNGEKYEWVTYVGIPAFNDADLKQKNPAETVRLYSLIQGELVGSHMWQGTAGPGFNISWKDDNTLRYNSFKRDREIFHLGYFAKGTASYDDVYYVLTWAFDYPEVSPAQADNEIRVLFQNLWMRPSIIAIGCVEERAKIIPDLFGNSRDVLVFSEAFSDDAKQLLGTFRSKGYHYQTGVLGAKEAAERSGKLEFLNGGVVIVSKHPPVGGLSLSEQEKDLNVRLSDNHDYKYIIYDTDACIKTSCPAVRVDTSCAGMDCRASKGVMYMPIKKGNFQYHIFATHTNASYEIPASAESTLARAYQLYICKQFIDAQNIPPSDPVIFVGDVNIDQTNPISSFPSDAIKELNEIDGHDIRFNCPSKCENSLPSYCPKGGKCINEYEAMLKRLHASHPRVIGYRGISQEEKNDKHYSFNPNINILATDGMGDQGYKFNLFLDYVLAIDDYLKPEDSYNHMLMPMKKDTPYECAGSLAWQSDLSYCTPISDHWAIDAYFKYPDVEPAPKIIEKSFLDGLQFGNVENTTTATYTLPDKGVVKPGATYEDWKKETFLDSYWDKKAKEWKLVIPSSDPSKSSSLVLATDPASDALTFYMGSKLVGDISTGYIATKFIQPKPGERGLEYARLYVDIRTNDMQVITIELYINRLEKIGNKYLKHRDYIAVGVADVKITKDWDKPGAKAEIFRDSKGETYKGLADTSLYVHR